MAVDKLIRVENLKAICEERSLTARGLVELVGGRDTYWHGMLSGTRPFGEKVARKIEEKWPLPRGWLDIDHRKPKEESRLFVDLADIERTNPQTYADLVETIHQMANGARSADELLRKNMGVKKGYVTPQRAAEVLDVPKKAYVKQNRAQGTPKKTGTQ